MSAMHSLRALPLYILIGLGMLWTCQPAPQPAPTLTNRPASPPTTTASISLAAAASPTPPASTSTPLCVYGIALTGEARFPLRIKELPPHQVYPGQIVNIRFWGGYDMIVPRNVDCYGQPRRAQYGFLRTIQLMWDGFPLPSQQCTYECTLEVTIPITTTAGTHQLSFQNRFVAEGLEPITFEVSSAGAPPPQSTASPTPTLLPPGVTPSPYPYKTHTPAPGLTGLPEPAPAS